MVDTFTTGKAHLTKQSTGSNTGAWGPILNTNEDNTDVVVSGVQSISLSSSNYTLSTSEARAAILKLTGTLSANVNVVLPSGVTGSWIVWNGTTGAFTVTIITTAPGLSVVATQSMITSVISDGTDAYGAATPYSANLILWAAKTVPAGVVADLSSVQTFINKLIAATQITSGVLPAGSGVAGTSYPKGTVSSGTYTPLYSDGNFQHYTNNGAHTLAPPANTCTIVVECTNGASAGNITTSGFNVVGGDSYVTTNGKIFQFVIIKSNSYSSMTILAIN